MPKTKVSMLVVTSSSRAVTLMFCPKTKVPTNACYDFHFLGCYCQGSVQPSCLHAGSSRLKNCIFPLIRCTSVPFTSSALMRFWLKLAAVSQEKVSEKCEICHFVRPITLPNQARAQFGNSGRKIHFGKAVLATFLC